MLIEDVVEVLTLLLLQKFIDQFVFIWGHEQCSMTSGQFRVGNYYCLKDLSHVYSTCRGLPYGKKDQTLFIDDESNNAFRNSKSIRFFWESFKRHKLSKNKVQWLDLTSRLWLALIRLPFASTVQMHFQTIIKFFKPHLNLCSSQYSWFM
jgi:hypothetical protein